MQQAMDDFIRRLSVDLAPADPRADPEADSEAAEPSADR